jgi:hypothetical protein
MRHFTTILVFTSLWTFTSAYSAFAQSNSAMPYTFCSKITNEAGTGVAGTTITVTPPELEVTDIVYNPDSTTYCITLQNTPPAGVTPTLTPSNNQDHTNGVTVYDILLIGRHILGGTPLDTQSKLIAADVNSSNSITTFDVVELRKLIIGLQTQFTQSKSWQFIDYSPLPGNFDFLGIKTGDVNNSTTGIPGVYESLTDTIALEVSVVGEDCQFDVEAIEEVYVDIYFPQVPLAWQYTLEFEGLDLLGLTQNGSSILPNFSFATWPNAITTADVSGSVTAGAYRARFFVTQSGNLKNMLSLSNQITRTIGYTNGPVPRHISLQFCTPVSTDSPESTDFSVWQNAPNPWGEATTINFNVQKNDRVTLNVYDVTGRLVHTQAGDFAGGRNAFVLRKEQLGGASGVLYYTVASSTGTVTRSMVVH